MFEKLKKYISEYPEELRVLIALISSWNKESLDISENFDTSCFQSLMQEHKLTSLIARRSEKIEHLLPTNVIENIKNLQHRNTKRNMNYLRELVLLSEDFNKKNIPHLFLKGPVLSEIAYGNPFLKDSIDLDILVPFHALEKTHQLLIESGYQMTYPAFEMTKMQRRINYKISHHYNFRHPEKKVQIELHWKLMNPQILLPLDFESLYERASEAEMNQYKIKTLSKEDYLLYLAVHGSKHRWYSLGWLKDFSMLVKTSSEEELNQLIDKALMMGLSKPVIQSFILTHLLFDEAVPENIQDIYRQKKGMDRFIIQALKAIQTPLGQIRNMKGSKLSYQFQLRESLPYRFTLLFRLRTHHSDWEMLKLPSGLFFLYYPLRPLLFLYRVLRSSLHRN